MPNTNNIGLEVPTTGSMPGTWGSNALNPNFVALDGFVSGVQTIAVSSSPLTLTAPAGPVITPGSGPSQSQNRVLVFTGNLTTNVQITLPLPAVYDIFNNTTGNFVLSFRSVGAGDVVAIPQGALMPVYNDGTDCFLIKNMVPGTLVFLAGETAMPAWVLANTKLPIMFCDGAIYGFGEYGPLGRKLGSAFGGNGVTSFGIPDLRGRSPIAYDATLSRITVAGCGINGTVIGAAGGTQSSQLLTVNLPAYTPTGTIVLNNPGQSYFANSTAGLAGGSATGGYWRGAADAVINLAANPTYIHVGNPQGGTSTIFSNIGPSQVVGSWFVVT